MRIHRPTSSLKRSFKRVFSSVPHHGISGGGSAGRGGGGAGKWNDNKWIEVLDEPIATSTSTQASSQSSREHVPLPRTRHAHCHEEDEEQCHRPCEEDYDASLAIEDLENQEQYYPQQSLPPPPIRRHCPIHPEVSLEPHTSNPNSGGDRSSCPVCLMNLTVKLLERRVEELELERNQKELMDSYMDRMAAEMRETQQGLVDALKNLERRAGAEIMESDRQLLLASSNYLNNYVYDGVDNIIGGEGGNQYSVASQEGSSQGGSSKDTNHRTNKTSKGNNVSKVHPKQYDFLLGQTAQPYQMHRPASKKDALRKITQLREGEGAWVKRRPKMGASAVWTYAMLKRREVDDAGVHWLVFVVNERGCTKTFPESHWDKFVRTISGNNHCMEDCFDAGARSLVRRTNTESTASSSESKGIPLDQAFMEESHPQFESSLLVLEDNEVSMYTLHNANALNKKSCEQKQKGDVVVLQDHEVSMYTLGDTMMQPTGNGGGRGKMRRATVDDRKHDDLRNSLRRTNCNDSLLHPDHTISEEEETTNTPPKRRQLRQSSSPRHRRVSC